MQTCDSPYSRKFSSFFIQNVIHQIQKKHPPQKVEGSCLFKMNVQVLLKTHRLRTRSLTATRKPKKFSIIMCVSVTRKRKNKRILKCYEGHTS
ncbi:unnamed protein product [Amoebophrya sp. A120]|nr:unnamed protein product [Amoebophrya sp. A120]|eukprot:GSA120T00013314001.1